MKKRKKRQKRAQKEIIGVGELLRQHRSLLIIVSLLLILGIGLWVGYQYIITEYAVTVTYVDGNIHYTDEEIRAIVMEGKYGENSLYLSLKYKDKSIEGYPFIEKMDVTIVERDTIRIDVYEKAIAGYVEHLGHYLYFDKDGIVVESSQIKSADVPQITGLEFDYAVVHDKLPVENEGIFTEILSLTQILNAYEIKADKLFFSENDEITLYFGDVKVALGTVVHIDEKVMGLQNILPTLVGKSGILRMENYDEYTKETVFESDL